jgi:hypothetical protein
MDNGQAIVLAAAAFASAGACSASAPVTTTGEVSSAERAENGYGYEFERDSPKQAAADKPKAVTLDPAARLPPEAIQAAIRVRFDSFRACYEAGLARAPNLSGTVAVKFAIGEDGIVTDAEDASSTLPDPSVVACIVGGFRQISFPKAHAGIVTVVYPIEFAPGG